MGIDTQVLKRRSMTAAIFVVVMLTTWLLGKVTFSLMNGVILYGLLYEWGNLSNKINRNKNSYYSWILASLGGVLYLFLTYFYLVISNDSSNNMAGAGMDAMFNLLLIFAFITATIIIFLTLLSRDFKQFFLVSKYILGLIFFLCSYGLLIPLYEWEIPFIILFSVWINDTMAYLTGSQIGKTPLAPKLSPKKTWEGTLGGILVTVLIAYIVSFFYDGNNSTAPLSQANIVLIALISSVMGTLGDLIQSSIKRMAGVKDSGNFMPGHGGFYDRFDAFSFAIVWVCVYLYFFYP